MNENFNSDKKIKKFRIKLIDIIFIVAALCISGLFFLNQPSKEADSKKLIIFNGEQEIEIPFVDQNINFKNDFYGSDFKRYNVNKDILLEVKDNKARVTTSDCPDKVCVNSGWASNCGHVIICMPNSFGVLIDCKGNIDENK